MPSQWFEQFGGGYQPTADPGIMVNPRTPSQAQDPQAYFKSLFPGGTLTPQQLASKEAELQAQGIRLLGPNAAGMRTKIELPNGQIVDVIGGAGAGHNRSQWMVDSGGKQPGTLGSMTGSVAGAMDYGARLPALEKTPGYQFRFDQGMKALQGHAAAKGTLLTGGAIEDAIDYGQGSASTEFDNEYRRLFGMAEMGYNAAGAQGNYGTSYGSNLTDLTTGSGNARANAALTSGQGWAGTAANLSNIGAGVVNRWPTSDNPYSYGYPSYDPRYPQQYSGGFNPRSPNG